MPKVYDKVTNDIKPYRLTINLHNISDCKEICEGAVNIDFLSFYDDELMFDDADNRDQCINFCLIKGGVSTHISLFCATKTFETLPPKQKEPHRVVCSVDLMGSIFCVCRPVIEDYQGNQSKVVPSRYNNRYKNTQSVLAFIVSLLSVTIEQKMLVLKGFENSNTSYAMTKLGVLSEFGQREDGLELDGRLAERTGDNRWLLMGNQKIQLAQRAA